jgi:hypothetical protein
MGRLVRIPQRTNDDLPIAGLEDVLGPGLVRNEGAVPEADNYMERIAKYIPGEVLAFFIFINAILEQAVRTGGKGATMAGVPVTTVAQGALVVCLVLTPLFIWYVRKEGDAWITNAFVSTLAFPFWAYVTIIGMAISPPSCSRHSRFSAASLRLARAGANAARRKRAHRHDRTGPTSTSSSPARHSATFSRWSGFRRSLYIAR